MPEFAQSRPILDGTGVALPLRQPGDGVFVLLLPVFKAVFHSPPGAPEAAKSGGQAFAQQTGGRRL
ncbi:MAG: hypothetical protein RSH52_25840, partial [Janthinobacterium sp.]